MNMGGIISDGVSHVGRQHSAGRVTRRTGRRGRKEALLMEGRACRPGKNAVPRSDDGPAPKPLFFP